jgi:hypothetical protein
LSSTWFEERRAISALELCERFSHIGIVGRAGVICVSRSRLIQNHGFRVRRSQMAPTSGPSGPITSDNAAMILTPPERLASALTKSPARGGREDKAHRV